MLGTIFMQNLIRGDVDSVEHEIISPKFATMYI